MVDQESFPESGHTKLRKEVQGFMDSDVRKVGYVVAKRINDTPDSHIQLSSDDAGVVTGKLVRNEDGKIIEEYKKPSGSTFEIDA